ncbi:hypothetical protein APHAL10511_001471 [Amanita phalloides]|nr:hypothetical protein APHAL10511_001471 [Amanita phalloides]
MGRLPSVHADNEWSSLKSVIVGRAGRACFPTAPPEMIRAIMPAAHVSRFKPNSPFPANIVAKAEAELNGLAALLEDRGIKVYRPENVDWLAEGGYTGAMARDGLMSVGNVLIESLFAFPSRSREIELAHGKILEELSADSNVHVVRRPSNTFSDSIFRGVNNNKPWVINNSRPAFDTADFARFGNVIIGQLSHVTNPAGVEYIRQHLPPGYSVELLDVHDPQAMHIDSTITALREGLLVYHPQKVTKASLRKHRVFDGWDLRPFPFVPVEQPGNPPLFISSPWICLNVLVLDA